MISCIPFQTAKFGEMLDRGLSSSKGHALKVMQVVKGVALELFALLACALTYFIKRSWFDPKVADPNKPNLLMVHGYLHNSSAWHYHGAKLKDRYNVYTIDLGSLEFRSIETYAKRIQQKMGEIQKNTGKSDLRIVAHSMGGLASTLAATDDGRPELPKVTQIVTLGSPLEGTKVALIAVGACGQEMRVNSPLIQKITDRLEQNTSIDFLHLYSNMDELIVPQTSARPKVSKGQSLELPYYGHLRYLFSSRVAEEIGKFLK